MATTNQFGKWALSAGVSCALLASVVADSADASTIGYWRFGDNPNEPGSLVADSGPNELDLALAGGAPLPTQVTLPATGPGSAFPQAVPLTQDSNTQAASFDGGGYFSLSDTSDFEITNQMTIEAYVNRSSMVGTRFLAAHNTTSGNNRSWFFGVTNAGQLRFGSSADGVGSTNQNSTFASEDTLEAGKDYYVAAVYNAGTVTFWVQNLTDDGELASSVVTGYEASLYDADSTFLIGNWNNGSATSWEGLIDEVRLSNTALNENQLLAVPEPASLALLGAGGLLVLTRRKRRGQTTA
ncbi:LamG domain-containing protein [Phycisphaerales bacterium AB-hyl4]|uniref:LamG domain-containing protein n=1 Tax=Natronomicrosphaera hydrolytica TaxID=3242702 RepID=A0ABV4U5H0_9BACT